MDIKYPVYEVITPQTGFSFKIRTLTLNDEIKLRTSVLSKKSSILNVFNRTLWDLIEDKPEQIQDYETFIKSVTVTDRKAITLGLYHISYGDEFSVNTSCPECGSTNLSNINLLKHTVVNMYNGKEPGEILLAKPKEVILPITKFHVNLKPPVLDKERIVNIKHADDKLSELVIIIDSMTVENKTLVFEKNIDDILTLLKMLPAKDSKVLQSSYLDTYGKYDASVKFKVNCSACDNAYETEADFMEQLFRMVLK